MNASDRPLVEVGHVGYSYRRTSGESVRALDDVSFSLSIGEVIGIVGPSGCGKSTLLNLIAGFLRTQTGVVTVDGQRVDGPGPDRTVVFQQDSLFWWSTVESNIAFGLTAKRSEERMQISAKWLEMVGIAEFARAYPWELSGGMQQRVNLARALAPGPKLVLMDEPFASLDAMTKAQMVDVVNRILKETRQSSIMVTHDIDEAILLSDRIVVLSQRPGRIREIVSTGLCRTSTARSIDTGAFQNVRDKVCSALNG